MTEIISYEDAIYGTPGWLAYDAAQFRLAAGGCRVQPGLTPATLSTLAGRMTLKQRVLRTNVAGAKCGLDLDPHAPHRDEVLHRFVRFLRHDLMTRLSMGCDMGTTFSELEKAAAAAGVPSIKYAVRGAQELDDREFFARLRLLDARVGTMTVSQRRAGHAFAHAAIAVGRHLAGPAPLRCAIQGFGTLGRGAVHTLAEAGFPVVAVADEYGCVAAPDGLDAWSMLASPTGTPVPRLAPDAARLPREAIFGTPADILLLAAGQDAITAADAAMLAASAVVVGANCGLPADAQAVLTRRDVLVVPDYIGGIGGSASMEVLFGTRPRPEPAQVLDGVALLMRELIADLLDRARVLGSTVTVAATELAERTDISPDRPPYGNCPYLASGRPSRRLVTSLAASPGGASGSDQPLLPAAGRRPSPSD